jgi:hypothetical protein
MPYLFLPIHAGGPHVVHEDLRQSNDLDSSTFLFHLLALGGW